MKKIFIISIVIILAVTLALVIKEKGLLNKWLAKDGKEVAEQKVVKEEPEKEVPTDIVDMDGFVFTVVKNGKVHASMEVGFKILTTVELKDEIIMSRSLMRARINSIVYDYIEKYYSERIDLEKMKEYILARLKKFYGKKRVIDVLYAFYYTRPAE